MHDTVRDIDAAIIAEEKALLRSLADEPGYFRQLSALFDSRGSWMNLVMMAAQLLLFAAGAYAAWQFFEAGDAFSALRWGLPSAVLLIMSLMIKLALWPVLQTNRILRALARLEPHPRDSSH